MNRAWRWLRRPRSGPAWLSDGRYCYAVSVAWHGHVIAVVSVRADDNVQASVKAVRHLAGNLHARRVSQVPEDHFGISIAAPGSVGK